MADEPPLEYNKWEYELKIRDAERAHDRQDNFFNSINEATIASANLALRTAVLVNGGAAVAMLAYVGSLKVAQAASVVGSLIWFACGVAAAVLGMAFAYSTNYCTMRHAQSFDKKWEHPYVAEGQTTKAWERFVIAVHVCGVVAGLASLGFFILGMLDVSSAIEQLAQGQLAQTLTPEE